MITGLARMLIGQAFMIVGQARMIFGQAPIIIRLGPTTDRPTLMIINQFLVETGHPRYIYMYAISICHIQHTFAPVRQLRGLSLNIAPLCVALQPLAFGLITCKANSDYLQIIPSP